jgi:hypothetical protein
VSLPLGTDAFLEMLRIVRSKGSTSSTHHEYPTAIASQITFDSPRLRTSQTRCSLTPSLGIRTGWMGDQCHEHSRVRRVNGAHNCFPFSPFIHRNQLHKRLARLNG